MLNKYAAIKPRRSSYGEPKTWNLGVNTSYGVESLASDGTTLFAGIYSKSYVYTDDFSTFNYKNTSSGIFYAAEYGNGYWVFGANKTLFTTTSLESPLTQNSSSFYGDIRDIYYGSDGYWVAVTSAGKIYTATDPTSTWTQNTSTATALYSVHRGSDGYWVAAGQAYNDPDLYGSIMYSTDPTSSWTTKYLDKSTIFKGIYMGSDGYWVTVGTGGYIYTATDPSAFGGWTQRASGVTDDLTDVYHDGTHWVIGVYDNAILYATDPTAAWTRVDVPGAYGINAILKHGSKWVAGNSTDIVTATDPTNANSWTPHLASSYNAPLKSVISDGTKFAEAASYSSINKVNTVYLTLPPSGILDLPEGIALFDSCAMMLARGGGYYVMAKNEKIYYSTTLGGTYTEKTITSSYASGSNSFVYVNGYFIMCEHDGSLHYATDPSGTWSHNTSTGTANDIFAIYYDGTYWVIVGKGGYVAYSSSISGTFTSVTSNTTEILYDVYYGGTYWVAVGRTNTLIYTTDPTSAWTKHSDPGFGTDSIFRCMYGSGSWVIAGYYGKIATTTNPSGTWTQRTSDLSGGSAIKSISHLNGYWIVLDPNNYCYVWARAGV